MSARRTRAGSGFTLVEIMIVVVLLGLLGSVVYASWARVMPRAKLNTAVRELAATIEQTRSEAISRGAEFRIQYYFDEGEGHPIGYRVITPYRAGGEQSGLATATDERLALDWKRLPDGVEFRRITLNGVDFTQGSVEVVFDGRGSASDHVIVLVQHVGDSDSLYTIEVQALQGFIQQHDGEFKRDPPEDGDFK